MNSRAQLDDPSFVHIRCGSDIKSKLVEAGFQGRFVEFSDPFCQGPVQDLDDVSFRDLRRDFVFEAYGPLMTIPKDKPRDQYATLDELEPSSPICLWFEHDSYDQLILAYLLKHLRKNIDGGYVSLICVDDHPAIKRFLGLGQLSPVQLSKLWSTHRQTIASDHATLGEQVWNALVRDDPRGMAILASQPTPNVPPMSAALQRHLMELPGLRDGLSLTQRLVLQILNDVGPTKGGKLFAHLQDLEPLPFLGDIMFWHVLEGMRPLFQPLDLTLAWQNRTLALSEQGHQCLRFERSFLELSLYERWVGGVRIPSMHDNKPKACWHWDELRADVVFDPGK